MKWLDDIEQRWKKATSGPWKAQGKHVKHIASIAWLGEAWTAGKDGSESLSKTQQEKNAAAIAHAPQDISRLLVVARAAKRLDAAVKLYLKHSNSPVCMGWDEMLDALTELDKALQEVQP